MTRLLTGLCAFLLLATVPATAAFTPIFPGEGNGSAPNGEQLITQYCADNFLTCNRIDDDDDQMFDLNAGDFTWLFGVEDLFGGGDRDYNDFLGRLDVTGGVASVFSIIPGIAAATQNVDVFNLRRGMATLRNRPTNHSGLLNPAYGKIKLNADGFDHFVTWTASPNAPEVPEPSTYLLFGGALLGMGLIRRRKS